VFKSEKGGAGWNATNKGLTSRDVRSLAIDSSTPPVLYAGTIAGVYAITFPAVGTFDLTPVQAEVAVKERLKYELTWTVPSGSWQTLNALLVRVIDDTGTILQVLWNQQTNTFSLYNFSAGKYGPAFVPGSPNKLESDSATLYLADSAVKGAGPDLPAVTLTLNLSFKNRAAGRLYEVEVAASDDLGNTSNFVSAGILTVMP
jgi:hypothetical protein